MHEAHSNGDRPQFDLVGDDMSVAFWDRVYVLRRRWWLLVLGGLVGGGVAYRAIRSDVPVYQAEATVQRTVERSPLDTRVGPSSQDLLSEIEIIRSGAVLGKVADRLTTGLEAVERDDSIKSLRRSLTVQPVPSTTLIRISYRDPDPRRAAEVVNETAAAYQEFSATKSRSEAVRRKDFVATQLAQVTDSLRAAQQQLADYQRASGTLNPSDRGASVGTALMAAETELRTLRYQEGLLQSILTGLRSANAGDEALRRAVVLGRDVVPGVNELFGRLQEHELERSRLTAGRFGETRQGANVQVLDSLIATTKQDIRAMAEQSQAAIRARLDAVTDRVADLHAEQGGLPAQASEFGRLQQRADAVQKTYDDLTRSYYEARVAEAVQGLKVEIVDPGTVPKAPVQASNPRLLAIAILLGMVLGAMVAFAMEVLDRKVRTPRDAEEASGLKLLGSVPKLKGGRGGVVIAQDEQTAAAESFRMLRTTIHFAKAERPRVLAITSAGPGEGKSLIATNLAVAIAQQGLTVLLVDADLRRPTIRKILQLKHAKGLSDVLVGDVTLQDAVIQALVPTLYVLPSGTMPPNPAELLGSSRFQKFLEQARREYDAVVIDTPPVLAVTDAAALSEYVDGVLLVTRAEYSQRHAVNHAARQLRHVKVPLIGVVLNAVPSVGRYGRYGSHYGYYGYAYTEYYREDVGRKRRMFSWK